ncbi:hypothetical protein KIH39_16560 [Telmatocola sphagniphila]|uniref:Carboxypeptidase regulatory-like domain-containing protein n=1 Tax=Telmatocola sphagniphila TaxID=1123043 RepID=A0A8E6EWS4_9BACT|nr:hypothetical protein [Telmatocola sphagniphila]QVL30461.1 hypothetical protein KIH39_16560 [Telmatocola sphagniphila]
MRLHYSFGIISIALLSLAGCGGDLPRSRVHGKITLNGKPLTESTVVFLTQDKKTTLVKLRNDGTYSVDGVVQGPVEVCIQQDLPKVGPRPNPTRAAQKPKNSEAKDQQKVVEDAPPASTPIERKVVLPVKYGDPKQSGLRFELKEKDQEWSVELSS